MKLPPSFLKLLTLYGKVAGKAVPARIRCMLVISGGDPELMGALAARAVLFYAKKVKSLTKAKHFSGLYVFHDEFVDAVKLKESFEKSVAGSKLLEFTYSVYEKSEKFLGTTVKFLVMDLTHDLKPNDLGRLIGIVEGGGLVVLLTPPWEEWDKFKTIFKENLTVPQFPEPRHIFITWIKKHLLKHEGIGIYDASSRKIIKKPELKSEYPKYTKSITIPEKRVFPKEIYERALTQDQVNVLKLMEELYEKPPSGKRKVFVLTADRGRGKSCAIGIGAVGLIHLLRKVKPKSRIIVTAPEPSNVQSLMTLASQALDALGYKYEVIKKDGQIVELRGSGFSIEYWEPLVVPKLKGDIAIVDEAAGIHVPLLYKIWKSYKRVVFSTTIHGYEGAGRGFSVRFLKRLKSDEDTILYEYEMTEPIRYNYNDPIERWQFDALLLDAEPAELTEEDLKSIERKDLVYVKYDPAELFENEKELRELFGIYVLAHYRNEPDDLGMIADAPHHIIRAVKTSTGKTVCAIQIAQEGPLPREIAQELLKGSKIPGNIIPDRFLKHARLLEFADTVGWRIVRIATHPSVQGKGIGSWALSKVFEEAVERGLDWLGSGFGASEELVRFWIKNGFSVIHISPDRNPVSGEYTVLVIKPISERVSKLVEIARREFKEKLLNSIAINYREMEPGIAIQLLEQEPYFDIDPRSLFSPVEFDRLWTYCIGPMTFEAAADLMFKIAYTYWLLKPERRPPITKLHELLLITKALQGLSWDEVAQLLDIKVKDAQREGHEIACIYYSHIAGKFPEEHVPGVEGEKYASYLSAPFGVFRCGDRSPQDGPHSPR